MPSAAPEKMTLSSWCTLPSRIMLRTARVDAHDLKRRHAPALHAGQELLGNHRLQHHGELHAHLLLLLCRENIDKAVDGLGRAHGVQRGKEQMARFRSSQGGGDGLVIAHLAQEDDVRRLRKEARRAVWKVSVSWATSRWETMLSRCG